MMEVLQAEQANPNDLKPHPRNYREHPPDQIEHLAESIKQHGFYKNVVCASDWTVLAGHGAVQAAIHLGMESIPVVRLDIDPDSPRALKVVAGDNEIANLAAVNDRTLTDILKQLKEDDPVAGLMGTGFDDQVLANLVMVTRDASEIADHDAAKEWADSGMPDFESTPDPFKLVISTDSIEERAEVVEKLGLIVRGKEDALTQVARYPHREADDRQSVQFQEV